MTNAYDELSDRARWFMENFDECGIAEICANNETAAKRAEAERDRLAELLGTVTTLAFAAPVRPEVRLSRIRELLDPADQPATEEPTP